MKTGTTNIKLNYKPLNATKSLRFLSGSERQNYNADTMTFEPDRRIDTLVVMVECGVTDPHNLKNGNVNADLNSVSWKISENGVFKDILESDLDFKIGKSANKGQLTIYKNISDLEPVTILFTAKYLEPISKRVVNFQEDFDLITLPIAQTPVTLEATMPVGGTLFVNKDQDGLLTQARLFRGIEQLPAAYYWYKGNTEITDANGYIGSKTEKLFVPSSEISSSGSVIRVEVADCSNELNAMKDNAVNNDPQVIQWRELFRTEGENLFLDGDFSVKPKIDIGSSNINTNLIYWGESNGDFNKPKFNNKVLQIGDGSGFGDKYFVIDQFIEVEYDASYIFNYDASIGKENSVSLSNSNYILFYNSNKEYISLKDFGTLNSQEWARNEFKFSPPLNAKYVKIRFGYFASGSGSFWIAYANLKLEKGNNATNWSPAKDDLNDLITQKRNEVKLPENYRPATKPAKTYKSDYLLIKKFPEYKEEVLITQGGIDASSSSVQVEMIIKTNDGVMQNPAKYFSVGWLKQTNGTFKYKGFKVNIPMADIVALNAENKELDYELREDLTLKV